MNIYQRMNAVMKKVTGVGKNQRNEHQRYNYAGHEAVTAALRTAYVECGIVRSAQIVSLIRDSKETVTIHGEVTWVNIDEPSEKHTVSMFGEAPATSSRDKGPLASATQVGVAFSYMVKMAEFKVFALTGDDTPDAASEETTRGEEQAHTNGQPVDVAALARAFDAARTEADFQAARNSVRKVVNRLTEADIATLTHAKNTAVERNGWAPR